MTLEEKLDDLIAATKKRLLVRHHVRCALLHAQLAIDASVRGDWIGGIMQRAKAHVCIAEAGAVNSVPVIRFTDRWTVVTVAREPAQVWGESSL